jgi:hypothetical protein
MARTPNQLQASIAAFAKAMEGAEVHRKVLHQRFGLTDQQIGMMVLARRGVKSRHPYAEFAKAVHAAQKRLGRG